MRERVWWFKLGWCRLPRLVAVWVFLVLVQAVWGLEAGRQVGQYRRQSWQVDNGLPQNTVHDVLQTRDGFLWLATEGGLVRFDGLDFGVFDTSNTPEFRSNFVDGLMEDRDGALWISTLDGLLRLRGGKFKAFGVADGLPSNTVTGVYQQKSGRLVAATAGGLAALEAERFREIAGTEFLSNAERVSVLAEDAQGTLWVAAGEQVVPVLSGSASAEHAITAHVGAIGAISAWRDGDLWVGGARGLECFRQDRPCAGVGQEEKAGGVLLAARKVTALLPVSHASDDAMWVGTTKGLVLVRDGVATEVGAEKAAGEVTGSAAGSMEIRSLFKDRSGVVWVMSSHGVETVSRERMQLAAGREDIRDVLSVLEDREGNMWFGTESDGVSVLRDQPFSSITTKDGLSADFVRAVFEDHAGTVWVGMDKGGVDRILDGKVSALGEAGGLRTNVVLALAETAEGMWIGTPEGLIWIRGGIRDGTRGGIREGVFTSQAQLFTADDGLADNFVRSLYADRDGSLWVGTRNGLSHRIGGVFRTYTTSDGLGSDVIGSVLRGGSGELWVGTLGGLSRLSGERFVNYTMRDGLGGDAVTALLEDGRGSLWVGTNRSGLTRWRDGKFAVLAAEKTGLPQTVYGMLEDGDGRLWMGSEAGVYRVAAAALDEYAANGTGEVAVVRYGVADGMQISECSSGGHPSAWKMRDGTLWFATRKGVAWVNPRMHSESDEAPPVVIEGVMLDDREAGGVAGDVDGTADGTGGGVVVVPAGGKRVTIRYAGLSFVAPQKVRYRYRLEGFDRGWVDGVSGRTAYYTNLPPGRYRFRVMAANAEGVWSARAASLEIRVQPRFYQTAWFRGLLVLCVAGLGYGLYRVRVHTVEARYKAVMAERGRLAREVHDTLAQGYVGVSVQLEIISRLLQNSQTAALEQLKQTKELVRSSLAEARSSIWNLRSHGKDAEILPSRMAAAAKSKEQIGGPAIVFEVHGTYRPLPREVEDEIFRIAQEAVSNSVRHASASRVEVSLTFGDKVLLLRVSDNGRGFEETFDSSTANGHFGLTGMRERAEAIDAQLLVEGGYGRGAVVSLRLDMRRVEMRHEVRTGEVI